MNKRLIVFLTALVFSMGRWSAVAQEQLSPDIGIASQMEYDSLLFAHGYHYLVGSVPDLLSPLKVSEAQFSSNLETIRRLRMNLYAVNIFIPGELKLVGPDVKTEEILDYVQTVFIRCRQAGIPMMVFGSGGARRIPDGFSREKAKEQIVDIAKKISAIAKEHNMVVALENLNSGETNFINTVEEALDIVKKVDHPNFRLCVDIYHMLVENESPEIIRKTKGYIIHCDLAEKENRRPPGTKGDDFRPYLRELEKIGYHEKIIIEARWDNLQGQSKSARTYLQEQINQVY